MEPTVKTLLYHEDAQVRDLVVSITMFPFELSNRWDEIFRQKKYCKPGQQPR